MKKILRLTLKKQYFDAIRTGTKKLEYREVKKHWISRLSGVGCIATKELDDVVEFVPREFDEIEFKNGYGKDAPCFNIECKGVELHRDIETPLGRGDFFVIKLGEIKYKCSSCQDTGEYEVSAGSHCMSRECECQKK